MDQPAVVEEAVRDLTSSLDAEQLQELLRLHKIMALGPLLILSKKQPTFFPILSMDDLPQEPVLEYVANLEVRRDIYYRLSRLWQESKSTSKLNMALFAVIMVAPINVLQSRLDTLAESLRINDLATVHKFFSDCETIVLAGVTGCMFSQDFYNCSERPESCSEFRASATLVGHSSCNCDLWCC